MCADVKSHTVIQHEQDVRAGGKWRTEVRDAAKNEVYWGHGEYLEVKPPEKIVFTWAWVKDTPGGPMELHPGSETTEVTVEFFVKGTGTELVLTHRGLRTDAIRREHEQGWIGCLNELEKTL